jgi:hypothetical protein
MNRCLLFLAGLATLAASVWYLSAAARAKGAAPLLWNAAVACACAVLYRDLVHDALNPAPARRSRLDH